MNKQKLAESFLEQRKRMIERQLKGRGIQDERVLAAFNKVPRELFVPKALEHKAYEDQPLPIGFDQTISQPYIVAFMTEALELEPSDRILEIGTGSGYQSAILAQLVSQVYSIETIEELHMQTKARLSRLGYRNIELKLGDGSKGWLDQAPFEHIMVTAAALEIPEALRDQLAEQGTLIIPLGEGEQDLVLARKERGVLVTRQLMRVRFVPIKRVA